MFVFCLFSFIISPPVSPLFLQFIHTFFFFMYLGVSVHCFLKFWVRSSEIKLHKLCMALYPYMQHCFLRRREGTTMSSCHAVVTQDCNLGLVSALPFHQLTQLYSRWHFPPAAHRPAQTDSHLLSFLFGLLWSGTLTHPSCFVVLVFPYKLVPHLKICHFMLAKYLCWGWPVHSPRECCVHGVSAVSHWEAQSEHWCHFAKMFVMYPLYSYYSALCIHCHHSSYYYFGFFGDGASLYARLTFKLLTLLPLPPKC